MPRPNTGPRLVGPKCSKGSRTPVYFIRWFKGGSKRERSTGTGDLETAEGKLQELIEERRRAVAATEAIRPRDPHEILITEILDIYGTEVAPALGDADRVAYAIDALVPFWIGKSAATVRNATCKLYGKQRYRTTVSKTGKKRTVKIADGTVRRELEVLRDAIDYCHAEGYLTTAPVVTLPPKPAAKERWLTRQEAARLIREARKAKRSRAYLPLTILIGLYTGQRREAIMALQWQKNTAGGWVDLESNRIDFNAVGRRQTKKRRPTIPIPPRILPFLKAARKRTRQYVMEYNGKRVGNPRKAFADACARAGVEEVTPHTMRHTAATWLAHARVPIREAAGFLGMSEETYDRIYAKHHPDYMKEARDARRRRT